MAAQPCMKCNPIIFFLNALLKIYLFCVLVQILHLPFIERTFHENKNSTNETGMQQVKQDKSEIYNYTHSKLATHCVNNCFKIKLRGLVLPLNFIALV